VAFHLEQAGFRVSTAASAEDALALVRREPVDLVLLDIGLPGMDGLDALNHFHTNMQIPVIFLTARRRELDEVVGMSMGADDYITKPFDMDVLLVHIKAVLRRSAPGQTAPAESTPLVVGDLAIDPAAHTVTINGEAINLTPREFDLLYTLALDPGHVISVEDLLTRVWGAEFIGEPQVVYVHIRWIREKIEAIPDHPKRIVTVRRVGYKLEIPGD
jgi:DNA-binding response OmpR family regulator